jgi:hypothetical protein
MKRLFAVVALCLTLVVGATGCPSVGCDVQTVAVGALAPAIATGLQCTNQAAITATLNALGTKAGLCAAGQSSLGSAACQAVSGLLLSSLAGAAIPAAWGCSPTAAVGQLTTLVNTACALIP